MSFLSPLFLAGAAAAAVPILLHLLKRQPEVRVKFSAVSLLRGAPAEHAEARRLRELLLLALRVAALVLLSVAFARPFLAASPAVGTNGVTVVALDRSYSMSSPGRFERAKALARDAVVRAPAGNLVAIVTFADEAVVETAPSADRALVAAAVDRASLSFGGTRYAAALAAASDQLGGRPGTIVVVTDLQEAGWDGVAAASVPKSAHVEVLDVGEPPPNLSLTAVAGRAGSVVATVRNSGASARTANVRVTVDERPSGDATVTVGPRQSADVTIGGPFRGAVAAVRIDDAEGLQADNVRYALLDEGDQRAVLMVTAGAGADREGFYVGRALAAAADASYRVVEASAADVSGWPAGRLRSHAAVILLSTQGLDRRGRDALADFVRLGGGVLVPMGPSVDADIVNEVLGSGGVLHVAAADSPETASRALAPLDVRHPIFQPFGPNPASLGLVSFQRVARIEGSACQPLARFTTGETAVADCAVGEGRALVLASDLSARGNDFPRHATFVPFVHRAVAHVMGTGASHGEYLVADVPPGVAARPGAVLLPAKDGNVARRAVVNVDPREGEPGRMTADEFLATVSRLTNTAAPGGRPAMDVGADRQQLWKYCLAIMLAVLAFEGIVAARTA